MTGAAALLSLLAWVAGRSNRVPRLVLGFSGALGLMGLLTILLKQPLLRSARGPSVLVWQPQFVDSGAALFFLAGSCMLLGSLVTGTHREPLRFEPLQRYVPRLRRVLPAVLCLAWTAVLGWLIGRGPASLIHRDVYLPAAAHVQLVTVLGPALPLAFCVGAFAWFVGWRVSGAALMSAVTFCAFAGASRLLAVLPLIWLIARLSMGSRRRRSIALSGIASWLALTLVLRLREGPVGAHGAVPYLRTLVDPTTYLGGAIDTLSNLLFAVPLAGRVSYTHAFTTEALAVSLSPLPTSTADWQALAPRLRVHYFIPFNAIGELASLSIWVLAAAFLLLGALLTRLLVLTQRLGVLPTTLVAACSTFVMVLLLQYNLRSGIRVVYLLAMTLLVLLATPRTRRSDAARVRADAGP